MNKPTSQKDPRMEWGFYAMTPRIVRTKYKELSHTEKWLYTCLKDLCGKKGTCFRTLRSLKEETDISIASLSTMIPRLHEAGLIHAEKKRSPRSGKEIWHISIVDIWQMNKDYCSEIEQSQNAVVQNLNEDLEIVHSVNKVVQKSNKETGDCSNSERGCSNFSDIRIYPENIDTEIDNEEEGTFPHDHADSGALAPTPAPYSHDSYSHSPTEDELNGHTHDTADSAAHPVHSTHHLESVAGDRRRDSVPAGTARQETTSERVAPSAAMPDSGYEKDEDCAPTEPRVRAVKPVREAQPEQQFSTGRNSYPQQSAKVEPKAEQDALIARPDKPEMPPESAKWCDETLVQIVEAKLKKRYREAARKKQIAAAQRILREDPELTREQFVMAYDERDDDWWHDHKGLLHVNHMAEKDRVHEMLDRLEARARKPARPQSKPKSDLINRTYWTDADWDNYRHYGVLPGARPERIQA